VNAVDLGQRQAVSLAEVLVAAPATVRVDRKYIVPVDAAQQFVSGLPEEYRVLEVDGRRWTSYHSTYFDTHDLMTCRAHVQRRRRRWKFRSRLYVEDALCRLEVKVQDGSGMTRKYFHEIEADEHGQVDAEGLAFLARQLGEFGFTDVGAVAPVVDVAYRRATLAVPEAGQRVTLDHGVRCERNGQVVELDPGHVIVETKGGMIPGAADALLRDLGQRPRSFSKYVASVSLTEPLIADNDIRRLVGRELHVRAVA
jgi:hypothetical protein